MDPTSALVESMREEAVARTGLDDFGDEWFVGPLTAWADDLQQDLLNDFGRTFLRSQAVKELARRLRVLDVLRRHPEIGGVPIPPILYVTGLARSGTTLLHNLLALCPQARSLRRWELVEPLPPPEAATYERDPRIATVQASVDRLRGSLLERMHWVDADDPEECVWGFLDVNAVLGQAPSSWMPSWRAAIFEQDQTPTFVHHRQLVQLLLWRNPVPAGGFLVLKAPQIAGRVAEFAAVFPEATFVVTHRDPYRCVVSTAVLCRSLAAPFVDPNPLTDDGRRQRLALHSARGPLAAIAAFADQHPSRVVHVAYPDLVRDAAGVVESVLARAPGPAVDLAGAVEGFLARQRGGGRAAPPASLDDVGYDHDDLWADPVVADYAARFAVERERDRLTGTAP